MHKKPYAGEKITDEFIKNLLIFNPAVIYICKAGGDYGATFISGNVVNQMGYEPEDFIKNSGFWASRIHPDDAPRVFEELKYLFEKGRYAHEYRFLHKNGTYRWMHDEMTLVRDSSGNPVEIYGTWLDITGRKKAEEELQTIMDSVPALIFYKDKENKFIRVNKFLADATGLPKEKMEGKNLSEIYPGYADKYLKDDMEVITSGKPKTNIIESMETPAGVRWLKTDKIPYKDESGNILGIIGFSADITEQKQAEEELKLKAQLLNNASDSITLSDFERNFVYINDTFCKFSGYTRDELNKMKVQDIIPPAYTAIIGAVNEALAEKGEAVVEMANLRKDGSIVPVELHSKVIESGGRKLVLSIVRDITERKRAENALKESEAKYKALIETTNTGYVVIDTEGRVVDANAEYARFTGHHNPDEIRGRSVIEWTADYEKGKNAKAVAKCAKDGYIRNLEIDYIDKGGKITPIEINATVMNLGGTPQIFTLCRDITERKQAEKSLQLNSAIMENVAEGIYFIGLDDGIIKYANPRFENMFGYSPGEMTGKNVAIVNAPAEKSPEETKNGIMEILRNTGEWHGEVKNIKKDGTIFWCYANVSVFDHPEYGKVLVAVHTDITDRKRAEEKIKIFSDAVENAYEAIVLSDMNLNINYANKSALNMLGYAQEEIAKLKIKDIDRDPDSLKNIDADMEKRGRWSGERFVTGKNKKETPVVLSVAFIKDKEGRPFGIVGSFVDITERKEYERQIEKRMHELEIFYKAAIGREERIIELKKKVEELEGKEKEI